MQKEKKVYLIIKLWNSFQPKSGHDLISIHSNRKKAHERIVKLIPSKEKRGFQHIDGISYSQFCGHLSANQFYLQGKYSCLELKMNEDYKEVFKL